MNVRLLGSYWHETDPDMIKFMRSLASVNGTGPHHGIMETVSEMSMRLVL